MLTYLVSKALLNSLTAVIDAKNIVLKAAKVSSISIDDQGEEFNPNSIAKWWVQPTIPFSLHPAESKPGEETDEYTFRIRGYIKSYPKGGRLLELEKLIDYVRVMVDPSILNGGVAVQVQDEADPPVVVGVLQFGQVTIDREFGVSENFKGALVHGLDRFTLNVRVIAVGGEC